jgi:hypothetical protein
VPEVQWGWGMSDLAKDYIRAVKAELAAHGVAEYQIDDGRKHKKLRFSWQGKDVLYVMPKSPSDWRASMNAVSDLRRLMGVDRLVVKNAERRAAPRSRAASKAPPPPESLTLARDGLSTLARYGENRALQDRIDLACYRLSFFKGTFAAWKKAQRKGGGE